MVSNDIKDESAGIIVKEVNSGKFLVVKQKEKGLYGFPKGHKNLEDRKSQDTASRELKEETGLVVEISSDCKQYYIKQASMRLFTHYIPDIVQTCSKDENEIESIHWFTFNELIALKSQKLVNITISAFITMCKQKNKMFTSFYKAKQSTRKEDRTWRSI